MSVPLDPFGGLVTIGNVTLRTPGLAGEVEVHPAGSAGMRSAELSTSTLNTALANERVETLHTISIRNTREVSVPDVPTRTTSAGDAALELSIPAAGDDWGQVVLAVDEAGVITWSFARDEENRLDVTRGAERRTFVVQRAVAPPGGEGETRGLIGAVGKKLLKVLVFPLLDPVIGKVGNHFAARWERERRPYRCRRFAPSSYREPTGPTLEPADWQRLSGGRALLAIHGTFSQAHASFGGLGVNEMEALYHLYDGRVFAFDHPTLSEDPQQNVDRLTEGIPEGVHLDLDILCHSRGGLVSRVLSERPRQPRLESRSVRVHRVVFVATPNRGTVLTDMRHMGDLVDVYTNLLNFLPTNGATEILEGVITVVKLLAVGAVKGLKGLQAMNPSGPFLRGLNRGPKLDTGYYALASDFEPTAPGWKDYVADRVMDRIFGAANDLVVPTAGVHEANGSGCFPITQHHCFPAAEGVAHTSFFSHSGAASRILDWLT